MMLEDVLEDPRPTWGRAAATGFGAAALVALGVKLGPDVTDAPQWWGFTTAVAAPVGLLSVRVAGGADWWRAVRATAAMVLVLGAGLALALLTDATDNAAAYVAVAALLGLVLTAAFRGRREPVPHVPVPGG